jgi:hypothetical protein
LKKEQFGPVEVQVLPNIPEQLHPANTNYRFTVDETTHLSYRTVSISAGNEIFTVKDFIK